MKLSLAERESALWLKIREELTGRLQILREKNDGDLDAAKTSEIRGQIRQCKEILAWGQVDPTIT